MMARDIPKPAGHSGVAALEGPPWIRTTMGYFLSGLNFRRWEKPSLDIESFVRPLKAFRFAPGSGLSGVVIRELAPFPDRSGPDLRRRLVGAAHGGREICRPWKGRS